MFAQVPVSELIQLAVAIAIGGVITGILAGLFGIGGGAVLVPVLFEVFRLLDVPETVRMQLCIGTSLAIIIPTAFRSYKAHKEKGLALVDVVHQWTVPAIIGVALGSALAAYAPSGVFKVVFAVIQTSIAIKMLFGRDSWNISDTLPGPTTMRVVGGVLGLLSAMIGVGGGAMANMFLTLYGKTIHTAVATAAGLGVPIAVTGTIGYVLAGLLHQSELPFLSIGFVSLPGFLLMAPTSTLTARLGAHIAHRMSRRHLEIAFGVFLVATAARLISTLI